MVPYTPSTFPPTTTIVKAIFTLSLLSLEIMRLTLYYYTKYDI